MIDSVPQLVVRPKYLQPLRRAMNLPVIKVLTGVRRSGKSVLLRMRADEIRHEQPQAQLAQIALDAPENLHIKSPEALLQEIEQQAPNREQTAYIFLDEVQLVPGWERIVNGIHSHWNCDIYLTGSNSAMLSGELATFLGGRYFQIQVQPFTFSEFCAAAATTNPQEAFNSFLEIGGFPVLPQVPFATADKLKLLADIFASTLLRDVIERHQIRDTDLFQRIIRYAQGNIGRTFSARSLTKFLKSEGRKVSVDTVLSYLQFCQEAFLFDRVSRQNLATKEILKIEEKYYLCDHGLRSAAGFNNRADIELVLENIVYRELLSRGYQVSIGRIGTKEIDFVASRGDELEYFQVCYQLASEETRAREFGALLDIPDNYPKHVLSLDLLNQSQAGIHHHNLISWLLAA